MSSVSPPEPAPPPPNCCRSGYRGRNPSCLKRGENTQFWSAVLGTRFHWPLCQSAPPYLRVCFLWLLQGGCLCSCCWRRLLLGRGVSERAVVGTDSFPRLPHSHTCRCCLMECDMDNSLHRSHQYTQLQHWRVPDTHTDTGWHKCYAHTRAHLTTQRCVSSQALFPQMERAALTHTHTPQHKHTSFIVRGLFSSTLLLRPNTNFCQHDYSWEWNGTKNRSERVWVLIGERRATHRGVLLPFSPTQTNTDASRIQGQRQWVNRPLPAGSLEKRVSLYNSAVIYVTSRKQQRFTDELHQIYEWI